MSATANAPAATGAGNSQPPSPTQKPFGTCATIVTTTMSAATRLGPIGPPRPSTVSTPPPTSASTTTQAQNVPGLNPSGANQPAVPATVRPFAHHPSCISPGAIPPT